MSRALRFLPLVILLLFVSAVAWRLMRPASEMVPSQMVGKPVPSFTLQPVLSSKPGLSSDDLAKGEPRMINVFASWCVPCIAEAPMLLELKRRGVIIDAVAVRDRPEAVRAFLDRHGDPFERIGSDPESLVQLSLGASGVPETFIVDGRGIITFQHMGPIDAGDIPEIMSEWEAAR